MSNGRLNYLLAIVPIKHSAYLIQLKIIYVFCWIMVVLLLFLVHRHCFHWDVSIYCYFPHTSLIWGDAEALCQRWGGHLASINSLNERNYLHHRLYRRPNYWIGFIDYSGRNTGYQWTDGTGGFTMWNKGQPDLRGKQMCAKVWTHLGTWDNLYCWYGQRVLCKKVSYVVYYCTSFRIMTTYNQ